MLPGAVAREVGGYEILAKLKAGGMATLYLARRKGAAGFSRHVAIKFVHDHLAEDPDFVRMFVNEALLQARITHPNVVHVEELGERDGQHFLVMEYVHGCSLSQLLRTLAKKGRALSPDLAVFVAMQVAAGLHAAHEARDEQGQPLGVVHRDVSPDNVLLAYEGHVKLIDFGVAKVESSINKTSAGLLKGKLRYMSPEQAAGGEIDRRTDVYALAIVLWEMLTMQRLFAATDQFQLLEEVRNAAIVPPSRIRAGIPAALEAVLMRALSREPGRRFATAHDFRRALAEALPTAMLTDASQLASLLSLVMAPEIENDLRRLPSAVASGLAGQRSSVLPEEADAALATMTITIEGLAYLETARGASGRDSLPGAGSQPSASGARPIAESALGSGRATVPHVGPPEPLSASDSAASPMALPPTGSGAMLAPAAMASSPASPALEQAPASGGGMLKWAMLGVVAVGAVAALALGAHAMMRSGAAEQIRVTPLTTTAAPTPAAPTPVAPTPTPPAAAQPEAPAATPVTATPVAATPVAAPSSVAEPPTPGEPSVAVAPERAAEPRDEPVESARSHASERRAAPRSSQDTPRTASGAGRRRPMTTEF